MMKKRYISFLFVIWFLVLAVFALLGCGKVGEGGGGYGGGQNPAVSINSLFNASGATAVAAASSASVSSSAIKSLSSTNVTELLKLTASGSIESMITSALATTWHPPISLIEIGPDGALYVGFQWGIWVTTAVGTGEGGGESISFFKIHTTGTVEVVDRSIYGVGSWYSDPNNGELPVKQVQFDSGGNLYYIGKTSTGNSILKKKTTAGAISQIGSNSMAVRDFLVAPNGLVFFHGSNASNWSIEWLKVISGSTVNNIFYNDGQSGWLRAYYYHQVGTDNYVYLVGENLTLLNASNVPQKYSGVIKVTLNSTGGPALVTAIYDDNNMYNDTYSTVGSQLTWGYWDPTEMTNKKFFAYDNYNNVILPLSLEAGVSEEAIRAFIRAKFQSTTTDTLNALTFAGQTTSESWRLSAMLDDLVNDHISGKTWAKWRSENGLQNVRFGNAKQLVFPGNGRLYAVLNLDSWGSGTSKGDKLFQIVNEYATPEVVAFSQDTNYYKSMSKVRPCGSNYVVYLSSKVGQYKIFRLDLNSPSTAPVDLITDADRQNIEIFNYSYDTDAGILYYDVYDLSNNTSYLAQQAITATSGATEVAAGGYTLTDIVPFTAN